MTTNELMRHLLTDIPDDDQRHLIEVVDRNHADQLARKRRSRSEPMLDDSKSGEWDDEV